MLISHLPLESDAMLTKIKHAGYLFEYVVGNLFEFPTMYLNGLMSNYCSNLWEFWC